MTDMQFNDSSNEFGTPPASKNGSDISDKLIAWGFVSSRKEAEYVLIAVAVLSLIVAYFVLQSGGSSAPPLLPQ